MQVSTAGNPATSVARVQSLIGPALTATQVDPAVMPLSADPTDISTVNRAVAEHIAANPKLAGLFSGLRQITLKMLIGLGSATYLAVKFFQTSFDFRHPDFWALAAILTVIILNGATVIQVWSPRIAAWLRGFVSGITPASTNEPPTGTGAT